MIYQGSKKYPVREVIVHCSATRADWMSGARTSEKVAEIKRWHVQDNGWRNIAYHYIIDLDGTVARGRAETEIGAHVMGHNAGTIGICLIGGHGSSERDDYAEHYTAEQEEALIRLIEDIEGRTEIARVSGHNEYASKACPGFRVKQWLPEARDRHARSVAPRFPAGIRDVKTQPIPNLITRFLRMFA